MVDPPISFKLDVMPVFMRAGCNVGSCHGSARGKDGFRLSLFGFDPDGDYYRLTHEQPKRRLDLSIPAECLLMEKATGQVPHSGGSPTKKGDPLYNTLVRWLEAGAPADLGAVPTIDSLEVYPPFALMDGAGETQQLTVRAKYSDGTDRDVTGLAVFLSSNDNAAAVSKDGKVTAANRGEAFVMNSVNVIAASADAHRTERAWRRGLDDAIDVFTFRDWFDRGLFSSTHFLFSE